MLGAAALLIYHPPIWAVQHNSCAPFEHLLLRNPTRCLFDISYLTLYSYRYSLDFHDRGITVSHVLDGTSLGRIKKSVARHWQPSYVDCLLTKTGQLQLAFLFFIMAQFKRLLLEWPILGNYIWQYSTGIVYSSSADLRLTAFKWYCCFI